jgi:hypothetical protein
MQIEVRNSLKIDSNTNVVIGLGDSFVEGHGAYPTEVWEQLEFSKEKQDEELNYGCGRYFEFHKYHHDNCFLSQLTKKYLVDYTPVNFGYSGNGNRAAVKALTTMHPELNLEAAKNKIVIFYVGQFCRFDFFNNYGITGHNIFQTVWPHNPGDHMEPGRQELWRGYATTVWNEKTEVLEFISNVVEVQNWCKLNNAKLVIVNSFEPKFDKTYIESVLLKTNKWGDDAVLKHLLHSINWDNVMPIPKGYNSICDLLSDKEDKPEFIGLEHNWYGWALDHCRDNKSFTPNGYFTPCAHPTIKGHELIAKIIFDYIKNGG